MEYKTRHGFAPIIIIVLVAIALAFGGGAVYFAKRAKIRQSIACTAEAKQCSDGSYVSRTGPNCEFAACPSTQRAVITGPKTPKVVASSTVTSIGRTRALNNSTTFTANPVPLDVKRPVLSGIEGWKKYRNAKYGFEFWYPQDHTAYTGINSSSKTLVAADGYAEQVSVAEDESKLFSGEVVVLKVVLVNEDMRLDDWVDRNLSKYVLDASKISRKSVTVAKKNAVEIIQSAQGVSSPHRIVVIQPGNYFFVATESAPSSLLDQVFGTLKFIQ